KKLACAIVQFSGDVAALFVLQAQHLPGELAKLLGLPHHVGIAQLQFLGARAHFRIQSLGEISEAIFAFTQRFLSALAVCNIPGYFGGTCHFAVEVLYGRNGEGNIKQRTIFSNADGLEMVYPLATSETRENSRLLTPTISRDDKGDVLADGSLCRM